MLVTILTFFMIVLIVVFACSKKYSSNHSHTWTEKDSEELHRIFEENRQRNIKLNKEMEIRKAENHRPVSEEVRKEREKTWDYYDIG